jgi:hypothetical protein
VGLIPVMPVAKGITQRKINDFDQFSPIIPGRYPADITEKKGRAFQKMECPQVWVFHFPKCPAGSSAL